MALHVHAHIARHWHHQGKPKKALDAALLGLGVANKHIPEGFSGLIEWGHLENRAYLRAMDMALHSYMRLRRHKDAAAGLCRHDQASLRTTANAEATD